MIHMTALGARAQAIEHVQHDVIVGVVVEGDA